MQPNSPNNYTTSTFALLGRLLNQWYTILFNLCQGLPEQGLTNQVLTKISNIDYNTKWAYLGSIPSVTIVSNVIAAYGAVAGDLILANTVAGGFVITLPLAVNNKGLFIRVKKISVDFNVLTIANSGADTIDGATPLLIVVPRTEVTFISDGVATWWIA